MGMERRRIPTAMSKSLLVLTGDDQLAEKISEIAGPQQVHCEQIREVHSLHQRLSQKPRLGLLWDLRNGFGDDTAAANAVLASRRKRGRNPLIALTDGFVNVDLAAKIDRASTVWIDQAELVEQPGEAAELLSQAMSHPPVRGSYEEVVLEAGGERFSSYCQSLRDTIDRIARIGPHDVPILITGETGSGKTTLAKIVHNLSSRRDKQFHNLACGAMPPELIESELFGHVRGAFTGAERDRVGRFEAADSGTLLLDEIDVLGLNEQVKLLRVLETGEFERVGETDTRKSRARLIFASNIDLRQLSDDGKFRSDLYYRLNTLEFRLPPLRERVEDIVPLAMQFAQAASNRTGIPVNQVHRGFLDALKAYEWPGNVRELKNQIERSVLLCEDGRLLRHDLNPDLLAAAKRRLDNRPAGQHAPLAVRIAEMERRILEAELDRNNNCRTTTAKALGISRVGLYKKLRKYDLI